MALYVEMSSLQLKPFVVAIVVVLMVNTVNAVCYAFVVFLIWRLRTPSDVTAQSYVVSEAIVFPA